MQSKKDIKILPERLSSLCGIEDMPIFINSH